jgi:hypothetical protein
MGGIGIEALEQIGTESNCIAGVPTYFAVWQMLPGSKRHQIIHRPVQAGDYIHAEVSYEGGKYYRLSLEDASQDWSFSIGRRQSHPVGDASSAECITESPPIFEGGAQLANFETTDFTECYVSGAGAIGEDGAVIKFVMTGKDDASVIRAEPEDFYRQKTAFRVNWISGR